MFGDKSRHSFSPPYEEPVPDTFGKGLGVVGPGFFLHKSMKNVDERFEPPLPIGMPMADPLGKSVDFRC